jgi:WD40 repeat protein
MKTAAGFGFLTCLLFGLGYLHWSNSTSAGGQSQAPAREQPEDIGAPLYALGTEKGPATGSAAATAGPRDPIVIPDCRLGVFQKQDVPSQREGVLLFIGTEGRTGEVVSADRLVTVPAPDRARRRHRLKEGDRVEAGQLLAQLDDRLARGELASRIARVAAARAEHAAAEKTRDEARKRYEALLEVQKRSPGNVSPEELRGAMLTWERYSFETISKREGVTLAEQEQKQAETVVALHEIRSTIPGIIKTIYRRPGEAVKALEPVLQVHDLSRLRVEGLVEAEYLDRLRLGARAIVEASRPQGPDLTLWDHMQPITGVAVSQRGNSHLIVSASEDGTVRVCDRARPGERQVLRHPTPVRCVACSPAGAPGRWCLTGAADGVARLWDLNGSASQPCRVFKEQHRGVITAVAFTPDGRCCATASEDREVCLWDPATGELRYRLPAGHRATITALQFTPRCELVSAARDNTLRVWKLGTRGAALVAMVDRRSGDVAWPGVSPDGRQVLLDQGKSLRLLTLADQTTRFVLENPAETTSFKTFALFSPDSRLILTAGEAEGRLQLWRAPTPTLRPHEFRRLLTRQPSIPTCAAFAPDGSFLVTGTRGHQVLVWDLPKSKGAEGQLHAKLTLIEHAVESSSRHVRVWAEVSNSDGHLLPGTTVTLTVYPD